VARYSMHLRDGTEKLIDHGSREFATLPALRCAVSMTARQLLSHDAAEGMLDSRFRIDAEDEEGTVVYSLRLIHQDVDVSAEE
jgi:hypothetical protein